MLSWQHKLNKAFQSYLLVTSNVPYFSTNHIENETLLKETFSHFSQRQEKMGIYISYNTFASSVCWAEEFFSRVYKDGITKKNS